MPRPRSGILWLSKPHVVPILRAIARGTSPRPFMIQLTMSGVLDSLTFAFLIPT